MRRKLIMGLAAFAALAGWASPAGAGLFSTTGPIIAILAGDLFLGEAEGHLSGAGTLAIHSQKDPGLTCLGQFTFSAELGGVGNMRCSDGATAIFHFQRLSVFHGYGVGSFSRGSMSFTYGLNANESEPYLKLPSGKALMQSGKDLVLVNVRQPVPAKLPVTVPIVPAPAAAPEVTGSSNPVETAVSGPIASAPGAAPDMLLSAATLVVTVNLKQDKDLQTSSPGKIAELVEATILPLFNFRHMTQLAMAPNWRLASPEQQNALTAEFRMLLMRTYSTVLTNYHDLAIEYKPLRIAPGETRVTVKSTVKQPGAERMTIDYDMEMTTAGWKVYDIKIAGISLITTYRSTFAKIIRDDGVDGLIESLSAKNRQADPGLRSQL